jgi:hypothetical protein
MASDPGAVVVSSPAQVPTQVQSLPTVLVYKDPTCGCCSGWVEHMRAAGFQVESRDSNDMPSVKRDAGVSLEHSSCHTALVGGYVVEGHVPADLVKKMIAERPDIAGIAAPGMPMGSPGMEGPGAQPYDVVAFRRDGRSTVYAEVDPTR